MGNVGNVLSRSPRTVGKKEVPKVFLVGGQSFEDGDVL